MEGRNWICWPVSASLSGQRVALSNPTAARGSHGEVQACHRDSIPDGAESEDCGVTIHGYVTFHNLHTDTVYITLPSANLDETENLHDPDLFHDKIRAEVEARKVTKPGKPFDPFKNATHVANIVGSK